MDSANPDLGKLITVSCLFENVGKRMTKQSRSETLVRTLKCRRKDPAIEGSSPLAAGYLQSFTIWIPGGLLEIASELHRFQNILGFRFHPRIF